MKILIVGSGGREHALAWKIRQSPLVDGIFIAPGNAGTAIEGTNVPIPIDDVESLLNFAKKERIALTIVGPEAPLMAGIVDRFVSEGKTIFGPRRSAALIEGSKAFAKELFQRANVPTASHRTFQDASAALAFIRTLPKGPVVVKVDGLAAGKGVIVCDSRRQAEQAVRRFMEERVLGEAGRTVVIEEKLTGPELSVFAFCNGPEVTYLASAQDHKPIGDGDTGENTGGMGAYSPVPLASDQLIQSILEHCHQPAADALRADGTPYCGMLYGGLILTDRGKKVLEFNARFGDPETQPILMRLDEDIVPWLLEVAEGGMKGGQTVRLLKDAAVCVVMASGGYPGEYEKGKTITGLEDVSGWTGVQVFHAGTVRRGDRVLTDGGRVLGVTTIGKDLNAAVRLAYEAVKQIQWEGVYYRNDIGRKASSSLGE